MTVTPDPARPAPLARVARPRRRTLYRMAKLTLLGGVAGSLLAWRTDPACSAMSETSPAAAARVCEREYLRTGDPATGARLAQAERDRGDLIAASAIARGLLATSARGNALRVLGEVAVSEHRLPAALAAFARARELHGVDGQRDEIERDDAAIARARRSPSRPAPAARP